MKRLALLLIGILFSSVLVAAPFKKIVVFGDSLSDIGNLFEQTNYKVPNTPPYYKGHFSNGPIWVEFLTQFFFPNQVKERLLDYAFGGSGFLKEEDDDGTIFTLKRQIELYLTAHDSKIDASNLYVIWMGANNYLVEVKDIEETLNMVSTGMKKGIYELANKGASHILILGLPDLGKSPFARMMGVEKEISYFCQRHNQALEKLIIETRQAFPNTQILYFDTSKFVDEILASPESYGLKNITDTCYEIAPELMKTTKSMIKMSSHLVARSKTDNCAGYLFFDPVHPTSHAHKLFAREIRKLLEEHGLARNA